MLAGWHNVPPNFVPEQQHSHSGDAVFPGWVEYDGNFRSGRRRLRIRPVAKLPAAWWPHAPGYGSARFGYFGLSRGGTVATILFPACCAAGKVPSFVTWIDAAAKV